jgi:hypothetical protein
MVGRYNRLLASWEETRSSVVACINSTKNLYLPSLVMESKRISRRRDRSGGAVRPMVFVADKPADVILLWEKNIIPWLISDNSMH